MKKSNNPGFAEFARKRKVFVWEVRKEHRIVYDDGWREIMKEVSRELKFPYEDVERINTAWWKYVGEMMCRVELPVIRMVFLCNLKPSVKKLYGYCEKMGNLIDRLVNGGKYQNRKVGDVGNMVKHLSKLHDTYFRLQAEKAKKMKRGVRVQTDSRKADIERMVRNDRRRQIRTTMVEARRLKEQLKNKME